MKFNKYLEEVLREMCKRANVKFEDVDFKEREWYLKNSWTAEEQEDFEKWLYDYLRKNVEARYELMSIPRNSKRFLQGFVSEFILNYGWTQK